MRAHQVDLEFTNLFARDPHIAQFAHAGRDRVGQRIACDNLINHGSRPINGLACVRGQQNRPALGRDFTRQAIDQTLFPTAAYERTRRAVFAKLQYLFRR